MCTDGAALHVMPRGPLRRSRLLRDAANFDEFAMSIPHHFYIASRGLVKGGGDTRSLALAARCALDLRPKARGRVRFLHAGRAWFAACSIFGTRVYARRDDRTAFLLSYHD